MKKLTSTKTAVVAAVVVVVVFEVVVVVWHVAWGDFATNLFGRTRPRSSCTWSEGRKRIFRNSFFFQISFPELWPICLWTWSCPLAEWEVWLLEAQFSFSKFFFFWFKNVNLVSTVHDNGGTGIILKYLKLKNGGH